MHALVEAVLAKRLYVLFVFHLAVFALVYRLAYVVRYDLDVPPQQVDLYWHTLPLLLSIRLTAFGLFALAFPGTADIEIATPVRVHNLDRLGLPFLLVVFTVVGIGVTSFVGATQAWRRRLGEA